MNLSILRNLFSGDKSVIVQRSQWSEAVLVLVGLGNLFVDWRVLGDFYAQAGNWDVFVPDYIARESLAGSVEKLDRFLRQIQIERYERVHVFAFILGSWVLNLYLREHAMPNLQSIIYDRSPLQERAPRLYMTNMPQMVRLVAGEVVNDLANTPYPALNLPAVKRGMMIETKATPYVRRHQQQVLAMGEISWAFEDFGQPCDDYCYLPLHHNDMYRRFDVMGGEIVHFFRSGCFTSGATRTPPADDPFQG
jgi:hypothetical protein